MLDATFAFMRNRHRHRVRIASEHAECRSGVRSGARASRRGLALEPLEDSSLADRRSGVIERPQYKCWKLVSQRNRGCQRCHLLFGKHKYDWEGTLEK